MILTDVHTHTAFSPDGRDDIEKMLNRAKQLNISYYGIAEHFDYDYLTDKLTFGGEQPIYTDAEKYFSKANSLKGKYPFELLAGCEFGFTENREVIPLYREITEKYQPDFIVNSVHTSLRGDYYYPETFGGRSKKQVYEEYLKRVLNSVNAEYDYDIIAHLGYCSRYSPYEDRTLRYSEFSDILDEILRGIAEKGKILEMNSSSAGSGSEFLASEEILARYKELGGEQVSFASDAHSADRILYNRDRGMEKLKALGFRYITVPVRGEYIKVKIE